MTQRIRKAADTIPAPAATHELTGMNIQEVSAVDRAANRRKFLVTKEETAAETIARVQAKIDARGDAAPGAVTKDDLGTEELPEPVPGSPEAHANAASAHAHAASAHANAAAFGDKKKKTEKTDVAPLPAVVAETPIVDPVAEMLALEKSATDAAAAVKKTDVIVTSNPDGSATISVEEPALPASGAPAAVVDAIKVSVLAGIDAIKLRLDTLRTNVAASKASYSTSGTPSELWDIWYIRDMLCGLYDIGGPQWELEHAADAALDAVGKAASPVAKAGNKVITKARLMKLQAAHKAMEYAHTDMRKVLKEMDTEGGDATGEMAADTTPVDGSPAPTSFAKAAVTEKDIEKDPRFVEMTKKLAQTQTDLANVQRVATQQAATIAKARGEIAPSNKVPVDKGAIVRDDSSNKVQWPRDLAADRTPLSKRF